MLIYTALVLHSGFSRPSFPYIPISQFIFYLNLVVCRIIDSLILLESQGEKFATLRGRRADQKKEGVLSTRMLKLLSIGRGQIFLACPTLCLVAGEPLLLIIYS